MIYPYQSYRVECGPGVFVAPSADLIGRLKIGKESNIWFQCVLRADVHFIEIGERTNIQDQSCLHVTGGEAPLIIGSDVTVGHKVLLHGCTIEDRVLVGMGSLIMDKAVIPSDSIVGAGSLVTENKTFPSGHLIMGRPARAVRELRPEERQLLIDRAKEYVQTANEYLKMGIGRPEH